MVYTIIVKEVREGKYEVEANSAKEAREMFETEYWKNPNEYMLEPTETEIDCL